MLTMLGPQCEGVDHWSRLVLISRKKGQCREQKTAFFKGIFNVVFFTHFFVSIKTLTVIRAQLGLSLDVK